jgi:hypothetical protein
MTALSLMVLALAVADVESGPKAGVDVPALKVPMVSGAHEGKDLDIPSDRKADTTVYLFVTSDKFDRPVARFAKTLDGKLGDAKAYMLWTGGDADKHKDYLPKVQQSLKLEKTDIGYSVNATPEGWGLNSDACLTVVIVKDQKVAKVFAYRSVNEKDADTVVESFKK